MRLKKIPVSKATTAWGLLRDVKRAITEEPKRANMGTYCCLQSPKNNGPRCGTVGCFAGWVELLRGYEPVRVTGHFLAMDILGNDLDYDTVDGGWLVFNAGEGDACDTTRYGTRAHARAVVQRINKFMRVNEIALKARQLPTRSV